MIRASVATAVSAARPCRLLRGPSIGLRRSASIDPGATANYVEDFVYQHTGFRALDVRCPSGIPATAGGRFNCHFTGPEGPYTAYMRILNVKGRRVLFE